MGELKPLFILILVFLGMWVLWYISGGVSRFEATRPGAYITPPSPVDSNENNPGGTYGEYPKVPSFKKATTTK